MGDIHEEAAEGREEVEEMEEDGGEEEEVAVRTMDVVLVPMERTLDGSVDRAGGGRTDLGRGSCRADPSCSRVRRRCRRRAGRRHGHDGLRNALRSLENGQGVCDGGERVETPTEGQCDKEGEREEERVEDDEGRTGRCGWIDAVDVEYPVGRGRWCMVDCDVGLVEVVERGMRGVCAAGEERHELDRDSEGQIKGNISRDMPLSIA